MSRWLAPSIGLLFGCAPSANVVIDDPATPHGTSLPRPADPPAEAPTKPRSTPDGELVLVEGGKGFDDEGKPLSLARFELDRIEVTVAAYTRCVDAGVCQARTTMMSGVNYEDGSGVCNFGVEGKADHPMNCVESQDAETYCAWVDKRLPTVMEWKLARSRDGRTYPWGNEPPDARACWLKTPTLTDRGGTCVAGSHPLDASADGVLDMAGNVSEWTLDDRKDQYYTVGGYWLATAAYHLGIELEPDLVWGQFRSDTVGFRCAKEHE